MTIRIDLNNAFVVPDDVNISSDYWLLKFKRPVSMRKLLDALQYFPDKTSVKIQAVETINET